MSSKNEISSNILEINNKIIERTKCDIVSHVRALTQRLELKIPDLELQTPEVEKEGFNVTHENILSTKLPDQIDASNSNHVAESLDRILHTVANNQQVVFGRLELLLERDDIDDQTKDELKQVFRAVEENNNLITEVKRKVSEMRRG